MQFILRFAVAFTVAAILGFVFHVILPSRAEAADGGYFNCLHLSADQKAWFSSSGPADCCSLGDGMPVRFDERPEGIFVPPYREVFAEAVACRDNPEYDPGDHPKGEDHSHWLLVNKLVIRKWANPIGVGVIWYVGGAGGRKELPARCMVLLPTG